MRAYTKPVSGDVEDQSLKVCYERMKPAIEAASQGR